MCQASTRVLRVVWGEATAGSNCKVIKVGSDTEESADVIVEWRRIFVEEPEGRKYNWVNESQGPGKCAKVASYLNFRTLRRGKCFAGCDNVQVFGSYSDNSEWRWVE
jgi:hypothetical protein